MSSISWIATAIVALLTAGAFLGAAQSATSLRHRIHASSGQVAGAGTGTSAGAGNHPPVASPSAPPPRAPSPAAAKPVNAATGAAAATATAPAGETAEAPAPKKRAAPTGPTGLVNLRASDLADVWVDGKRIGRTPVVDFELSAGPHKVRFDCHQDKGPPAKGVVRGIQVEAGAMQSVEHDCPEPSEVGSGAAGESSAGGDAPAEEEDAVPIE